MESPAPGGSIAPELEIRLFGHANVSSAGVPVKFPKRSTTLAMLALLVLQRGKPMTREALAFTLFPEVDESAALAELRRYLYLINKALPQRAGDPWIVVDADAIRWNAAAGAFVDVIEFERLSELPGSQSQAIELYAGDLLHDVYDDWVLAERERLRGRYLDVLAGALDRHRAERAFGPAIACAKRILTADPWREDIVRTLIAVRYESGDAGGALSEYEQFAKRLRDELAIAPMPETVAVRQSILRNEAVPGSLERPAAALANAGPRRRESISVLPFVGRRRELTTLRAAWARAAHGAGSFVLIAGEAGVGKTRLAAELARISQAEGGRVFVGTTSAPESMPYQALTEALRSAVPLLLARPPSAARRAVLGRLLPELRDSDASEFAGGDAQTAERESARVFDALTQAVRTLASPRPLLLILEDLQWAGSAGIEALGAIVRETARVPVLIVVTCRIEETPLDHPLRVMQRSLRNFVNVDEIELERLGEDDVSDLVARVEGLRGRGDAIARELYAHSEGNALFLNEAINGVLENADLRGDAGGRDSVSGVVAVRVERLTEGARAVAEIAAVAGAGCSVALVRDVSNFPAASVARGLDELLDGRILREASARGNHDYVFTHHLIAAAIYDRIDPVFRAQRHARIARVLEAGYEAAQGASSREIALHFERAGDGERAGPWYLTAARQSVAVYAYGDAIELASRALHVAVSAELRASALDLREKAHGRRGDRNGQREDIDALEQLAGDDPRARFDVLARRVLLSRALGDSDEEGRLIAEMDVVAERLGDAARAHALVERATHAGLRSKQTEGLAPARAALEIYERLGDLRGQLDCLYLLVDFTTNVGDLQASRTYLEEMRVRAASLTDRAVEARALAVAATAALLRQEYRECFDLTERALALNLATGDREAEAASRGRLAVTAVRLDDFATALREFERTLEAYGSMGHKRGLAITYTNRTTLLMRMGLFEEALDSIERSNAYFESVHEQRTIVANLANASFVKLHLGDAAGAKALAQSALGEAREIGFPVFEAGVLANLGNAERALGEWEAAIAHMEAGLALRRPIQEARDFADDLADLTFAYVDAGRHAEALRTARELAELGESSFEGAFWPHYGWWAIAAGLRAGGEIEAAARAASRARTMLREFAARIDDAAVRSAFLALAINREILATN
jgi:DNA-binding SARP family transcriptional activator/energy-coupling factor transporter ATP-binding protein EcfA2